MCGHVGVAGRLTPRLVSTFNDLLNFDMVRGYDSTGVCFVDSQNKVTTLKNTCLPYELMLSLQYQRLVKDKNIALMGHNRAATKGKVKVENAHPFLNGHITLAHNGTLNAPQHLPDYDASKDATDSEAICKAIASLGIVEAWKKVCGAATIVWWNSKERSLNILSNSERPFFFCFVNNESAVVWSSDRDILKFALARRDVSIDNKEEIIIPFKNRHYKITAGKKGALSVDKTDLEPFSYQHIHRGNVHRHGGSYRGDLEFWPKGDSRRGGHVRSLESIRAGLDHPEHNEADVIPFATRNPVMTEKEFHEHYKECLFCGDTLEHEFGECTIIDAKSAACVMCSKTAAQESIRLT